MASDKENESNSLPEITPARRNILQQLFENGNKQMSLGGHDYANDMFVECVLGDPGNLIYIQSFVANLRLKYGERKKRGVFGRLSSGGLKTAELRKRWMDVLKSGVELLKSNPWDDSVFASMGRACLELGLDEAGLAYLKHSIDCNPSDVEVNRLAARVLRDMKKYDDSLACWNRVLKYKKDDEEANRALGDIMVEKTIHRGGYDSAESSREVRTKGPSGKGQGSLVPEDEDVMGRQLTYEEQIQRRLKKDPGDVSAYIDLAEYHFQGEKYKEAEQAYRKAIEMNQDNIDLQNQLLDTQKRQLMKDLEQLKLEYAKNKSPEIKEKFEKTKILYDQKNLELAEHRVKTTPGNATNHFELGSILQKMGRIKEAIGEFQQAKNDTFRKGEALLALGQCFQQIKQYKLASTHYQQAIDSIPDQGEDKKRALYLATRLAMGLKEYKTAGEYAHQLAALDFSYKDIGELLDKIAQHGNNT